MILFFKTYGNNKVDHIVVAECQLLSNLSVTRQYALPLNRVTGSYFMTRSRTLHGVYCPLGVPCLCIALWLFLLRLKDYSDACPDKVLYTLSMSRISSLLLYTCITASVDSTYVVFKLHAIYSFRDFQTKSMMFKACNLRISRIGELLATPR